MSTTLALELNDRGIVVAGDPALEDLEPSLGWAVVEAHEIQTGADAAGRLRLNPRLAHRHLWAELALEPLPQPFPRGLSTADLAYTHLDAVWRSVEARLGGAVGDMPTRLLVVSGAFTPDQLGLLLGIAESLDRPFTGLVDSAVAAASGRATGEAVVLDLDLERAVATRIGPSEPGRIARRRVRTQQGVGWNRLLDLWAREVGRDFVKTTRFDPLHTAGTEQQLYQTLPTWVEELSRVESIEASLEAGGRQHRIVLTRSRLAGAAESIYGRMVDLVRALDPDAGGTELLLTHGASALPGLIERFSSAGIEGVDRLPRDAALAGALRNAATVHQPGAEELLWVVDLPVDTLLDGDAAPIPSMPGT